MQNEFPRLVIKGLTRDGALFRPSDWAERLIDTASAYGLERRVRQNNYPGPERRQRQIAFLQVQMIDGKKCLVVDLRLREANPAAYAYIMEFVENNQLCWHDEGTAQDDIPQANR